MNFRSDVAIQNLVENGLVLPHNHMPGSYPGGFRLIKTEAEWMSYTWNPPQEFPEEGIDATASPKPTWAELQAAFIVESVSEFKTITLQKIRTFTTHLISLKAYGAHNVEHEKQIKERLADDPRLTRMNEYKEHYRTRYHEIKHWINQITEDSSGQTKMNAWVENIDSSDDPTNNAIALFSGATWTPPGEASPFADHANVPTYEYIHHENPPPTTTESSL